MNRTRWKKRRAALRLDQWRVNESIQMLLADDAPGPNLSPVELQPKKFSAKINIDESQLPPLPQDAVSKARRKL